MRKKLSAMIMITLAAGTLSACGGSSGTYDKYMKLGEYKGLEITKVKTEITEETLQTEIDVALEENAEQNEITDRACENGDMINIDFTGTIDGEEFEGGSGENYDLRLGEGYFLEDLETGIVGMETGEQKDIAITFPEDYDAELGGKEAVFAVTLNSVYEENIPEYNDEFVAKISDFSTTEEYEEDLKNTLMEEADASNLETAGTDALSEVIANTEFSGYPDELYEECKTSYEDMNAMYAEMLGVDVEDFESSEEETKASIEEMVYEKMVITAIAEQEKLEVQEDEYKEYLASMALEYGYDSEEDFEGDYSKEAIEEELLRTKVLEFLLDHAEITEVTEDEYYSEMGDEYDLEGEEDLEGDEEYDSDDEIFLDEDIEGIEILDEDLEEDMITDNEDIIYEDADTAYADEDAVSEEEDAA